MVATYWPVLYWPHTVTAGRREGRPAGRRAGQQPRGGWCGCGWQAQEQGGRQLPAQSGGMRQPQAGQQRAAGRARLHYSRLSSWPCTTSLKPSSTRPHSRQKKASVKQNATMKP
jgi:hypothetical protein